MDGFPIMSGYSYAPCLQRSKVSSLMVVPNLAVAGSKCPEYNQRPRIHSDDTEHLEVRDLPNVLIRCEVERIHNKARSIRSLFLSVTEQNWFIIPSPPLTNAIQNRKQVPEQRSSFLSFFSLHANFVVIRDLLTLLPC